MVRVLKPQDQCHCPNLYHDPCRSLSASESRRIRTQAGPTGVVTVVGTGSIARAGTGGTEVRAGTSIGRVGAASQIWGRKEYVSGNLGTTGSAFQNLGQVECAVHNLAPMAYAACNVKKRPGRKKGAMGHESQDTGFRVRGCSRDGDE